MTDEGALRYQRPVLLDRDRHRDWRLDAAAGFAFAREVTTVPVAAVEFGEACKEYAVVFARGSRRELVPVVMLGLRRAENLFIDDAGQWRASYLPAAVRRYPFVLAPVQGQVGVCLDEAYPGLHAGAGVGQPLFDAEGGNTPFLQATLDFLQREQHEMPRTERFCRRLEEAGLLTEMQARAELADGRSFNVGGLLIVDEKKLMALPDAVALDLFRSGELHLVSMHLASLANLKKLVDGVAARGGGIPPAPPP